MRPTRGRLAALIAVWVALTCSGGSQLAAASATRSGGHSIWASFGLAILVALAILGAFCYSFSHLWHDKYTARTRLRQELQRAQQRATAGGRDTIGLAQSRPRSPPVSPKGCAVAEDPKHSRQISGQEGMLRQISSWSMEDVAARQVSTSTAFADQLITSQLPFRRGSTGNIEDVPISQRILQSKTDYIDLDAARQRRLSLDDILTTRSSTCCFGA